MKRICTICARGGSQGVERKNIRLLSGLPLIAYSIKQARQSKLFDIISVSSDDAEILQVALDFGVDYTITRPDELATDFAPKLPVIQHCVEQVEMLYGSQFDIIVDLDVTSPLRIPEDIQGVVSLLVEKDAQNVITGSVARRSPYFNLIEIDDNGIACLSKTLSGTQITRRQDSPKCYDMNASIYAWSRGGLLNCEELINEKTYFYEMPEERSFDIDSELDFRIVEMIMSGN